MKKYRCKICSGIFSTKEEAQICESRTVSQDNGVKIGDEVKIVSGEHQCMATVVSTWIIKKDWAAYDDDYWHTVGLGVTFSNRSCPRMLCFDDYVSVCFDAYELCDGERD